uniref:Leucine-rich repeat-containing N-terminal plant-type domain-containing protein n=1 Tax=Ananas comosus var. bracteatus TaxID=296719 RepID=A0A6V7QMQ3_ANACO|nr:unnamed protein product [Ananas comosus var. bracteatus]
MAPSLPSFFFFLLLRTLTMAYAATSPDDIEALRSFVAAVEPASVPAGSCLSTWDLARDPCDSAFGPFFTCGLLCSDPSPQPPSAASPPSPSPAPPTPATPPRRSRPSSPSPSSPPSTSPTTASPAPPRLPRRSTPSPPPPLPLPQLPLRAHPLLPLPPFASLAAAGALPRREPLRGPIPGELSSLRALAHLDLRSNNLSGPSPTSAPSGPPLPAGERQRALGALPGPGASPRSSSPHRSAATASAARCGARPSRRSGAQRAGPGGERAGGRRPRRGVRAPGAGAAELGVEPAGGAGGGAGRGGVVDEPAGGGGAGAEPDRGRAAGFFGMMPRLAAVGLEGNRFVGVIPPQYALRVAGLGLGEWAPFARLMLAGNYLIGPIPSPMEGLKEGSAVVTLADNCLLRCPRRCTSSARPAPEARRHVSRLQPRPIIPSLKLNFTINF